MSNESQMHALIEPLERRLLLSAGLMITEFMADNTRTLDDGDAAGRFPDWIEIHNPTDSAVGLDGWYLTDKADDLTKWPFPNVLINPGQYMVVFASSRDVDNYVDAGGYLHTNFALKGGGEYLALVAEEAGVPAVVHEYGPQYPEQVKDISFGLPESTILWDTLLTEGAEVAYYVPAAGDDVLAWTEPAFDDSAWADTAAYDQAGVLITEVAMGDYRGLEIQNVSADAVATAGWRVLLNDPPGGINAVGAQAWDLPASVAPQAVLYGTDDGQGDFHWSHDIPWGLEDDGWAMIIDPAGNVMDFVVWGYTAARIATLDVSYGGLVGITASGQWDGDGAPIGAQAGGVDGFVAFNDHVRGGGTHANTTSYAPNGIAGGLLKNAQTGAATTVTLTTSQSGVHFANNGAPPAVGTDAYMYFNGYVDFAYPTGNSMEIEDADHVTHTFTGLDTGNVVTYNFAGTAIRGSASYTDRWTRVALEGAAASTPAHSSGNGVVVISPTEVAIWVGHNSGANQGFVAAWTGIDPGPDGEFKVISRQYTGATPGVGSGSASGGDKGYGLAGIRLEEIAPLGPTAFLRRTGDRDSDAPGDFLRTTDAELGTQNPGLTVPFGTIVPALTGVGFSDGETAIERSVSTDIGGVMRNVNASLWTRIEFEAGDAALYDALTLRMKYDDGFVAYLNGMPVASAYPPETLAWNSAATSNRTDTNALVYENFDISDGLAVLVDGINVLAVHALNDAVDNGNFLLLPEVVAMSNIEGPQYMTTPTPGAVNVPGGLGFVADTVFSVDRGFYTEPFDVEITTATPLARIYYTLDGSLPTEAEGALYSGPIHIAGQTILRAAAYKPGYIPTDVDTQTYIFLLDVVNQDYQATLDAGLPSMWGGTSPDYGMDPDVIGTFDPVTGLPNGNDNYGGVYAATIADDLKSLPTMSIVANVDDLFGSDGIYTKSTSRGAAYERAASAELIYPDGTEGFQVNAGLRIQGGYFRQHSATRKHSFRLLFKGMYGPTKLNFPLFGDDAADSFDTIVLRSGANDGYTWSAAKYTEQYIRDEFGRRLQLAAGQVSSHGMFVHLYVNGVYWGLYNPVERPDDAFSSTYVGSEKEDWDALHVGETNAGTRDAWNQMRSLSQSAGSSNAAYQQLQGNNPDGTRNPAYPDLLDVENYIDYLLINVWGGNWDWPWKNWWAGRDSTAASTGFKFYNWDFENTMGNNLGRSPLEKNALNNSFTGSNNAGDAHSSLKLNAEYRLQFADQAHRLMYNGGVLTPDSLIARYSDLADMVERAMVGESARWGDSKHSPPLTLYDWYDADQSHAGRDWILHYYLPRRTDVVLDDLESAGLYPSVSAPTFRVNGSYQHGGAVGAEALFSMPDAGGTIYYTLDGTDPRAFGGAVVGTAYSSGQTIPITQATRVKARVRSAGGEWSALNVATFYVNPPAPGELTITEINYNPHAPTPEELAIDPAFVASDFEFVEMLNTTGHVVDLLDVKFADGIDLAFTTSDPITLAAGQYAVVVASEAAFEARYGTGINVVATFTGLLNNGGERLKLAHPLTPALEAFTYNDSGAWPNRADGRGSTLELIDPAADHTIGANWRSSSEYGGTPGQAGAGPQNDVVINEVLTHTDIPQVDAIELHNTTGVPIDVGGWFLSDTALDYAKFEVPSPTVIPVGGYVVFYEGHYVDDTLVFNQATEFGGLGVKDFALSSAYGDDVWLLEADGAGALSRFVDHVEFGAAANGESFGLWPDAAGTPYPMQTLTLGAPNSSPRTGPLVISEVHYHPENPDGVGGIDADDLEFIEIRNPTDQAVNLWERYFVDGEWVDYPWTIEGYAFATGATAGASLAPGERLVVVPFDPIVDTVKLADFTSQYGLAGSGVRIVGPYDGQLDNAGETVRLERPDAPPVEDTDFTPYLIVDEVVYDDQAPWPTEPDTDSMSLNRIAGTWGNAAASWLAEAPTPGTAADSTAPTVVTLGIHSEGFAAGSVDSSAWTTGRAARTAPWSIINRIVMTFDEPVIATASGLTLTGMTTAPLTSVAAAGSGATELIWTVAPAGTYLAADCYTMALAPSATDAAGNPVAAGWPTDLNVLPGDINGDGRVSSRDRRDLRDAYGSSAGSGSYTVFADLNADGRISSRDRRDLRDHYGVALPAAPPPVPAPDSDTAAFAAATLAEASPAAPEARNPKYEIRNKLEKDKQHGPKCSKMLQTEQPIACSPFRTFGFRHSRLFRISYFGFRASGTPASELEPDLSSGLTNPLE